MTSMRAISPRRFAPSAVIDPPATAAVYAPLQRRSLCRREVPRHQVRPDRQGADLFGRKAPAARGRFIFVHGGGYTAATSARATISFYDTSCWAAKNGIVGVNATYRLAPRMPGRRREDAPHYALGLAYRGARRRSETRILCGHSAGGTHVASYAVMPQFTAVDAPA